MQNLRKDQTSNYRKGFRIMHIPHSSPFPNPPCASAWPPWTLSQVLTCCHFRFFHTQTGTNATTTATVVATHQGWCRKLIPLSPCAPDCAPAWPPWISAATWGTLRYSAVASQVRASKSRAVTLYTDFVAEALHTPRAHVVSGSSENPNSLGQLLTRRRKSHICLN